MPSAPPRGEGLVVEIKGLRLYPGLGPGDGRLPAHQEPSMAKMGCKRPRVYCLLRWSGRQARSAPAVLAHDTWWCPSPEPTCFRVEWPSPAREPADSKVTVEIFDAGSTDEDEDEDSGSLYNFRVSSVGSFKVPVTPEASDEWYACHSCDGSVLWGLFARVAVRPLGQEEEDEEEGEDPEQGSEDEEEDEETDGSSTPTTPVWTGTLSSAVEESSLADSAEEDEDRLVDGLGFVVDESAREEFLHLQSLAKLRLTEQQLRWDRHRKVWSSWGPEQQQQQHSWRSFLAPSGSEEKESSPALSEAEEEERIATLRALVWDGVPQAVRKQAYGAICAAARKQEAMPQADYYLRLVAQTEGPSLGIVGAAAEEEEAGGWVCVNANRDVLEGADPTDWDIMPEISESWGASVAQEIELDIGRAFAGSETYLGTEGGRASLRRVLRAYALRNPVIGYCQGMNFIAGLMLLVADEETAFWVLCHMCEEVNPLCYSPRMLGTKADMQALVEILQDEVPRLYDHCARMHLHLELWAAQWFLVYYINVFPPVTALRIIEVAMTEGSDIVFAVAVSFLRLVEPSLLDCDDLSVLLDKLKGRQATMYDADLLLAHTRRDLGRIRSRLRTLRAWHLSEVMRREPGRRNGSGGTRIGGGRGGGAALYAPGDDRRVKRMLARSLALGRRLLGISAFWDTSGRVGTMIDRRVFETTHRYLVEGRVVGSITPYLLRALRWLMRWPVVTRRTGELVGSSGHHQ